MVLSALFLENQMGIPSPDWYYLRFGDDAKMSIEFTKIMHFEHGHIVNIDNF